MSRSNLLGFRPLLAAGLSCLALALPAQARITPEEVWQLWQEVSASTGYSLKAEQSRSRGGDLTLESVTLDFRSDQVQVESTLGSIVLRQVGDAVEFTLPGMVWLDTTVTPGEGEDPLRMRTAIDQNGYLGRVSGSAETPVFETTAARVTIDTTLLPAEDDAGVEAAPKTTITLRDITGTTAILSRAPLSFDHKAQVATLDTATEILLPEDGGVIRNSVEIEALSGTYRGALPAEAMAGAGLTGLLAPGAEGEGRFTTGALRNRIEASAEVPAPSATIAAGSSVFDYGQKGENFRFSAEFKAVDAAQAEADLAQDSTTSVAARGDFTLMEGEGLAEGIPNTAGTLKVTLQDITPLLERLVKSGLMPQDQMMAAQFMMALFTRPGAAPNQLETVLELKPDGQVIANGQRLR